ncbi:hypothetical protein FA95DRAFT_123010 [Auriscalpium vulgare]|uniref:Uncharacterized protein n=1 Tax=Auriscalpium vulgare TaxID=40419 RepID=A0ACB8RNE4_9AGAM|nr:hypothetical protein FA95DRAFT_123010 [Auriscalpium vulgare]
MRMRSTRPRSSCVSDLGRRTYRLNMVYLRAACNTIFLPATQLTILKRRLVLMKLLAVVVESNFLWKCRAARDAAQRPKGVGRVGCHRRAPQSFMRSACSSLFLPQTQSSCEGGLFVFGLSAPPSGTETGVCTWLHRRGEEARVQGRVSGSDCRPVQDVLVRTTAICLRILVATRIRTLLKLTLDTRGGEDASARSWTRMIRRWAEVAGLGRREGSSLKQNRHAPSNLAQR